MYSYLLPRASRLSLSYGAGPQLGHLKDLSVYMDVNATTPLLPEVLDAMTPWLLDGCGNASSEHSHGRAHRHVEH
jgi:hypothetical protein